MPYTRRIRVNATATVSGNATQSFYTPIINGQLEQVVYRGGTASGFSTNGHMNLIAEIAGHTLLSVTTTGATDGSVVNYFPRALAQGATGNPLGFTSAATPPGIPVLYSIADERLQIEISSASNTSAGGRSFRLDLYISGGAAG